MTREENFIKNAKCKHGHRSAMSNSDWGDLNKNCTVVKLHDVCRNPKCICQKQITFTPKQLQLEGSVFKNTMKNFFKGTEKMWNYFSKPGLKIATPINSAGVAAKTKNPQSAEITSNILKSLTSGKNLSLTDLHGHGLRFKFM